MKKNTANYSRGNFKEIKKTFFSKSSILFLSLSLKCSGDPLDLYSI